MPKPLTLEDIMNDRKFQVAQHKYDNARAAITNGYSWAAKLYPIGSDVEGFLNLSRHIANEYLKDLNKTLDMIEEPKEEQLQNGTIKPTTVPRPS